MASDLHAEISPRLPKYLAVCRFLQAFSESAGKDEKQRQQSLRFDADQTRKGISDGRSGTSPSALDSLQEGRPPLCENGRMGLKHL